jgi:hypothetical protein
MTRTLLILVSAVAAGVAGHWGWYAARRPDPAAESQLAWVRRELDLAPEQYRRLREIHARGEPELRQLAGEVARLREQFAAFERERLEAGQVDFLQVARAAADSRTLDLQCDAAAQRLIAAALGVMTPEQRRRYLELVGPTRRPHGGPPL